MGQYSQVIDETNSKAECKHATEGHSPMNRVVLPTTALLDTHSSPLSFTQKATLRKAFRGLLRQDYMPTKTRVRYYLRKEETGL